MFTALCPLTYRGYNYDFTTGLYYLQSRYYNPEWGRFINCDDTNILLATQGETHGANLFAYCNNNPVNRVDYTGMKSTSSALDIALKFIIFLYLSDYYTRDYFIVSQYAGAGAVKILINKNNFIQKIYDCVCIDEDSTYDVLAFITNYIFREAIGSFFARKEQRSILFSDECIKEEIKLHANGYMAALDMDNISMPMRFSIYSFRIHPLSSKKRKQYIETACEEIDIKEYDVASPIESVGFSYYSGIRECYKGTKADPYYSEKNKR